MGSDDAWSKLGREYSNIWTNNLVKNQQKEISGSAHIIVVDRRAIFEIEENI